MARGQTKNSGKSVDFYQAEFVNVELRDEDRAALAEAVYDSNELLAWMEEMCADNYRFSVTFDTNSDVFVCTVTGKAEQVKNANLALAGRAPELMRAVYVAMYKHVHLLKEDWTKAAAKKRTGGIS